MKFFCSNHFFLIITLLLITGPTRAEGNCPQGYYPIGAAQGTPGPQGCAPIPGYVQGSTQSPSAPPPRSAHRWGAIATDFAHATGGAAFDQSSKSDAKESAITNCRSNKGINCKIAITYHDQCVALTGGDTGYNTASAASIKEAVKLSLETCRQASDTNCIVKYTSCSLPARVD